MKKSALLLMLGLPLAVMAQNPAGMSEEQMQQMMQQAQQMQSCMANIDQAAMQAFEARSQQMSEEVKALCSAGKRDEAMAVVTKFGKESAADPAVQQMRKCGEGMQNMMPKLAAETQNDGDGKPQHICDSAQD